MPAPLMPEAEFIELFESIGPQRLSEQIGCGVRSIYKRRDKIEKKIGRQLTAPGGAHFRTRSNIEHSARHHLTVHDGTVLVGSDCHYWPGAVTTAHRAFVHFCRKLKPAVVILNGDVMDGASVSRHPSIGWENKPTIIEEIETCRERLDEIVKASPKAEHVWTLGNHDARFESRLANVAPEYAKVHGMHLKDHFGLAWQPCWSVWINESVVVKHRFKSGIHAPHNNTIWAGKTIVTGHLHSLKVMPISDYNGTRWGVDCGTMAEPTGPQFIDYLEDNPTNWRSGFVVLTFRNGELMMPELVWARREGVVEFRGELINV